MMTSAVRGRLAGRGPLGLCWNDWSSGGWGGCGLDRGTVRPEFNKKGNSVAYRQQSSHHTNTRRSGAGPAQLGRKQERELP